MIRQVLIFCILIFTTSISVQIYDPKLSKLFAIYSGIAYCPKKCLIDWSCKSALQLLPQFTEVSYINNDITLASAFVGYQKQNNLILVSFRGSANIQNWIEDFNFQKVSYPNCKGCQIHVGFFDDYKIIENNLDAKINDLISKHPTATLLLTGHSLGGAMSQIGGLRLKNKFNKKTIVHNFGSPRVGNNAFSQFVQNKVDKVFRVVHNKDIVPHLPPQGFQYHHPAFEVFWDQKFENYQICSDTGEDRNCSNKYAPQYSAVDHGYYFMDLGTLKC